MFHGVYFRSPVAFIIPPSRVRYLAEIATNNREYDQLVHTQSGLASRWYQLQGALQSDAVKNNQALATALQQEIVNQLFLLKMEVALFEID